LGEVSSPKKDDDSWACGVSRKAAAKRRKPPPPKRFRAKHLDRRSGNGALIAGYWRRRS